MIQESVILDVDGVLLSFENGFRNVYRKIFDKEIQVVSNSYNCAIKFGISPEEEKKVWDYLLYEDGFKDLPLLPGAEEGFHLLKQMNKKIHIVTGIADQCMKYRIQNLHNLGLDFDTIDNVPSGTSSKFEKIKKYNAQYYFDDRLQHLNENKHIPNLFWINDGVEQFGEPEHNIIYQSDNLLDCVQNSGVFLELQKPKIRTRKF